MLEIGETSSAGPDAQYKLAPEPRVTDTELWNLSAPSHVALVRPCLTFGWECLCHWKLYDLVVDFNRGWQLGVCLESQRLKRIRTLSWIWTECVLYYKLLVWPSEARNGVLTAWPRMSLLQVSCWEHQEVRSGRGIGPWECVPEGALFLDAFLSSPSSLAPSLPPTTRCCYHDVLPHHGPMSQKQIFLSGICLWPWQAADTATGEASTSWWLWPQ